MSEAKNQCCGCIRGLPTTALGMHRTETELFMCTRARYRLDLEPKATDTWHKARKGNEAPFTAGGSK